MNQGLKNYTKQFIHDVSGVGRLAFNMCGSAKNMHMAIPLISTPGKDPIELSLIYNEQEKDVEGQFGKGFRLNLYKKITEISGGYEIVNADGSVDKYLQSDNYYNKETGLTLIPQDYNNEYEIQDSKGGKVHWYSSSYYYPELITDNIQNELEIGSTGETIISISNKHNDVIVVEKSSNKIYLTYTHSPFADPIASTVLTLTDGRVTNIQYKQKKEGSTTFEDAEVVNEVNIVYGTNFYKLVNNISKNITKVVFEENVVKIFDGFMNGTTEAFNSNPDYTITYNTLNTNTYNKTTVQDQFGNSETYHFNGSHLLNMVEDQDGKVKHYSYNKETKSLIAIHNVFVEDNKNLARNLSFTFPSNSTPGGDLGLIGPTEPVLGTQSTVAEIWNKLTYYATAGTNTQTISVSGEAGDTISLSFFMDVYTESAIGAAEICLAVGGASKVVRFSNQAGHDIEMHTVSVMAKENFSNVQVSLVIPSGSRIRIGAYTMLKKKFNTEYTYTGKQIDTINKGGDLTRYEYDANNNQTKVVVKEKTFLERLFNNNVVTQITNKNGTIKNIEYDASYPTNILKEQIVNKNDTIMVEERQTFDEDGRFVTSDFDEFGKETKFEHDDLGRITKVTKVIEETNDPDIELSSSYEKGLLKALQLNSAASNTYTYDERNRLTRIDLPGSSNYEFVYDYKNQITQVKMNGIIILTYTYDSFGNITRQRYGTNGDYYDFVYDSKNRIIEIHFNGSLKYEYEFENDLLVNVFNEDGYTIKEYVYDEENRLIEIKDFTNSLNTTVENLINSEDKATGKTVKVGDNKIHQSFVDFEKSEDAILSSVGNVKTIGFVGTNLTCDGKDVLNLFDIYPLHHDANPIDKNKTKPLFFMYKNTGGENQPKNPFVYDSLIRRFTYCANNGTLAYKFGNSTAGTVVAKVLKTSSDEECVFSFIDENYDRFDVILESTGYIGLSINGSIVSSTRMVFSSDTWHTVGISYGKGDNASSTDTTHTRYYRLFLDGSVRTYSVEASEEYDSMRTCVGFSEGPYASFTGTMEMLCFRNAYCEEETLDSLMNAINVISTKTYVDEFQRVTKKEVTKGLGNLISNEYEYFTTKYGDQDYATYRIKKETISAGYRVIIIKNYEYDELGRITSITTLDSSGTNTVNYSYDERGFLIKDHETNITYEGNGNVKTYGSDTFEYNSAIKDKLTDVGSTTIQYNNDSLFPSSIGGHLLTWEGRRLKRYTYSGGYYEFEYNEQGLRTLKKNHMGRTTRYYYDGSRLVTEINPSNRLDFLYDEAGLLYGFILNKANKYFYVRDVLQNILGLVDESGNFVVKYSYNAFGKILSVSDTSGLSIGTLNPFRYKGYYYDEETQLYWVSSRYYSPELCRWISPDSIEYLDPQSINGLNLYAYCGNDPVNYYVERQRRPSGSASGHHSR